MEEELRQKYKCYHCGTRWGELVQPNNVNVTYCEKHKYFLEDGVEFYDMRPDETTDDIHE